MPEFAKRGRARATARRAAAWLVGEAGDTMVEVMVAALIVALIAAAVFVGFGSVADIAGAQRHQAAAATLAQQDEDRMRGLSVVQLTATDPGAPTCTATAGTYGNECYTQTVDGETYTVTSTAKFVSASDGAASCTSSTTDNADYIETASTVTWANSNDGRPPVIEHSVVSPHVGGGLTIQVTNGSQPTPSTPLPGVTIDVNGSDTGTLTLTTDSNGCAVFAGLPGGTYTVSWPGYIQENTGASSASAIVVDGNTETDSFELGQPGTINASFTTTYGTNTNVAATTDTFVASNPQLTSPIVSGTPSTLSSSASYSSSISTGATIFPLAGTGDAYSVYAGDCVGDVPPSPATTVVTPGGTSNVTVPEPAMLIDTWGTTLSEINDTDPSITYYSGSTGYAGSASTDGDWYYESSTSAPVSNYFDSDAHYDGTTGDTISYTFTGTAVEWLSPTSNNYGYANVKLDGTTVATNVSGYTSAASNGSKVMYSAVGLTNGTHTLTIVVDGTKPSGSSGTYVAIDAIIAGTPTYYNNNNAALTYTGSWTYYTASTDYDDDESYNGTTGNKVTFTFTGNAIQWIGSYAPSHGNATVSLDGGAGTTVDTYEAVANPEQVLYSATGLSQGTHTLTITVAGTKDSGSSGYVVSIDALIVGSQQLLTTAPNITLTDNNCAGHESYPSTQVPTAAQGALTNPGEPYGNFTVCADNGSVKNTATVANTNFTSTGNTVNVYLYSGAPGLTSGTCT